MQHRNQRLADRVREEIARLIREEVRDPRVGFVTVTGVDLSPDLRHANVFVSILGENQDESLRALRRAAPFLRRGVAQHAGLRFTPELRFEIDESIDTGFRVDEVLEGIRHEWDEREDEEADAPAEPGSEEPENRR